MARKGKSIRCGRALHFGLRQVEQLQLTCVVIVALLTAGTRHRRLVTGNAGVLGDRGEAAVKDRAVAVVAKSRRIVGLGVQDMARAATLHPHETEVRRMLEGGERSVPRLGAGGEPVDLAGVADAIGGVTLHADAGGLG